MQHTLKHVERPGGSEGVGRKKSKVFNTILQMEVGHLQTGFKQQPICTPLAPTRTKSFAILRSLFMVPRSEPLARHRSGKKKSFFGTQTVLKMRPWKFFSFLFYCAVRSRKWDRQAVPFLGLCFGSFFEVCSVGRKKSCIKVVQKRNVLVSMKLGGLWRPEGQLGRPFWAKLVLRRFSGPRIGSVGGSCFVDDLVSC